MHKNTKTESNTVLKESFLFNIKESWSIPNNDKKWLWIVGHLISHKKITVSQSQFTSQNRLRLFYIFNSQAHETCPHKHTWFYACATRWYAWFKRVWSQSGDLHGILWLLRIHSQRFSHLCCDNEDSNMFMDKLVNLFNFIMLVYIYIYT